MRVAFRESRMPDQVRHDAEAVNEISAKHTSVLPGSYVELKPTSSYAHRLQQKVFDLRKIQC